MREIWKDIPTYDGLYQASSLGRIRSLGFKIRNVDGSLRDRKGRVLKAKKRSAGYLNVSICGRRKDVHLLVAMTFLDHKPNGKQDLVIDHINNNKEDNSVSNLQLISQRLNSTKDVDKTKTSSKYVGVYWHKSQKRWCASIRIDGKKKHLGTFKVEEEARDAYLEALENLG